MLALAELREARTELEYRFTLSVEPIEMHGALYTAVDDLDLLLVFQSDGASITVTGHISGRFSVECARCLSPAQLDLSVPLNDTWPADPQSDTDEDFLSADFVSPDGEFVDLTEYALEVLLESLPFRVLCTRECRGLCSACGANLNEEKCRCDGTPVDPRLAVLGRLLDKKEV